MRDIPPPATLDYASEPALLGRWRKPLLFIMSRARRTMGQAVFLRRSSIVRISIRRLSLPRQRHPRPPLRRLAARLRHDAAPRLRQLLASRPMPAIMPAGPHRKLGGVRAPRLAVRRRRHPLRRCLPGGTLAGTALRFRNGASDQPRRRRLAVLANRRPLLDR